MEWKAPELWKARPKSKRAGRAQRQLAYPAPVPLHPRTPRAPASDVQLGCKVVEGKTRQGNEVQLRHSAAPAVPGGASFHFSH
jgi:hypothetical protein